MQEIVRQCTWQQLTIADGDSVELAKAQKKVPTATALCLDSTTGLAGPYSLIICNPPWIASMGRHKAEGSTHFEHVSAYQKLLSSAKGSVLACLLPSSVCYASRADEWRESIESSGLEVVECTSMGIFRVPCAAIILRRK